MKLGFIGCGNMANAIIKGITAKGVVPPANLYIFDLSGEAMVKMQDAYAVQKASSATEVFTICDVIVLAVKPSVIASVLREHHEDIKEKNPLLISIAAGKTLAFLEEQLPGLSPRLIRVMPNINAKAGEAMCGYCCNEQAGQAEETTVNSLFSAAGRVLKVDEKLFPIFSVLAGCGPAFAYLFIDALARAGVKNGMRKEDALQVAAQTVLGSAKLILESGEHPWELVDQVCSPGGTTIEAVTSLQADGMEAAVHKAVDKAVDKDKLL